MMKVPTNDEHPGTVLADSEIETGKKSFFIRDILESSSQNNHINSDELLLPSNERFLNWILQNRTQFCLEQNAELDAETDSLMPILNEMTKYSMLPQKDVSVGSLTDSWLNLSTHMANITTNSFYQQLYYYALQNQLTSFENNQQADDNPESLNVKNCPESISPAIKDKGNNNAKKGKNIYHKNKQSICKKDSGSSKIDKNILMKNISLSQATGETTVPAAVMNLTSASLSSSSSSRNRRNRTVFSELQLMGLERRFDSQKYLSTPDRSDLARALGLTQLQVKTWYQNRRMKWKKQVMQNGCPFPPTKPKGRPKKDSIPTYGIEFTNSILCSIFTSNGQDDHKPSSVLASSSLLKDP